MICSCHQSQTGRCSNLGDLVLACRDVWYKCRVLLALLDVLLHLELNKYSHIYINDICTDQKFEEV